jgi:diacylglycerol kinase family enzyme
MPHNHDISSAPCIINPRAASHKWRRNFFLRRYLQKKLKGAPAKPPFSKSETIRRARELSRSNDFLVVVGGDGTISDVIQGIFEAGTNGRVKLGIIPMGSGNAFPRSLNIPKGAKQSLRLMTEGRAKPIDLIRVNGRIAAFVNIGGTAECGYYAHKNFAPGALGHFLAIWPNLFFPRQNVEVEMWDGRDGRGAAFDHKKLTVNLLDAIVTKTGYFGYDWKVAPYAVVDDGFLDITFFEMPAPAYVALAPFIYIGLLQRKLRHYKARKMVIRGRRLAVQYNGEDLPYQETIELEVIPRAIHIVVPA